jgi:hypothetical protein
MDYLPIQASAVPCERVFSSSAETITKKRNRIGPTLMEALQMLKFFFKKERLDFMKGWAVSQQEMLQDEDEEDILATLLTATTSQGIDNAIKSIAVEECDEIDEIAEILP